MNRTSFIVGMCLSLLLIGGVALDVSAQQPPPPPAPTETTPTPANPTPPTPRTEYGGQPPQAPPSGSQIETRPIPLAEGERGTFLGVDPTVAMIIGAVLLIVIVFGLVAMSRRNAEVRHTHTRHHV
ncbi:MAG TPA: hypothetical protein VLK35_05155 [Methylomirabilota bacterium]|nr:hypothetical protein [Methylomirabilota bacterium]